MTATTQTLVIRMTSGAARGHVLERPATDAEIVTCVDAYSRGEADIEIRTPGGAYRGRVEVGAVSAPLPPPKGFRRARRGARTLGEEGDGYDRRSY